VAVGNNYGVGAAFRGGVAVGLLTGDDHSRHRAHGRSPVLVLCGIHNDGLNVVLEAFAHMLAIR